MITQWSPSASSNVGGVVRDCAYIVLIVAKQGESRNRALEWMDTVYGYSVWIRYEIICTQVYW